MGRMDLDAFDAARSEFLKEPHTLTFKGETFQLVPELPIDFSDYLALGELGQATRRLFLSDEDADRFLALRPAVRHFDKIVELYQAGSLGESQASVTPSEATSNGSRPTLPVGTA